MNREEKMNKMIEEIKIRRNDEQYRGGPFPIYHIEFDILTEEIERLKDLVKQLWNNNKSSNLNEEQKELLNSTIFGSDKE